MTPPFVGKNFAGKTVRIMGSSLGDTVFSHSAIGTVNVTRMLRAIKHKDLRFRPMMAHWEHENIAGMLKARDLDYVWVERLIRDPLLLNVPIVMIHLEDDDTVIVDGNHRIAAFFKLKVYETRGWVIEEKDTIGFRVRTFIDGEEFIDTDENIRESFVHNKEVKGERK